MIPIRKRISMAWNVLRGAPRTSKRSFDGGRQDRLNANWNLVNRTADAEIQFDIVSLRARSRDLVINNPYGRSAIRAFENNVLKDEVAYSLQMKSTRPPEFMVSDVIANRKIEEAWKEWCKPKNCSENGDEGFYDMMRMDLISKIRDGVI